jgi:cell division septation protein DedD
MRFKGAAPHLLIYYKARFLGQALVQGFIDDDFVPVLEAEPAPVVQMAEPPAVIEAISPQRPGHEIYLLQDITVAPVIRVVRENSNPQKPNPKTYRIQIGAFREPQNTEKALLTLKSAGFNPISEPAGDLKRVLLTGITREDISRVTERIDALGYQTYIIRED